MRSLSNPVVTLDYAHSLYNLHGNGVKDRDKTLLLEGIRRRQVLYSIEEPMPIVSLALNLDSDG